MAAQQNEPADRTVGSQTSDDDGFGFDDLDQLAERAVAAVMRLVGKGTALAGAVLIFAVICCVGGFLLGIAALDDGIETVWIVLAGLFGILALGSVVVAMLRLRGVTKAAGALVGEVRRMISGDASSQRTVIDVVETSDQVSDDGVVVMSQQFIGFKQHLGDRAGQFRSIASALTAVTSFPGLVALATVISFIFLGLSVIFLVALAL